MAVAALRARLARLVSAFGLSASSRPAVRRVAAAVVASCVLVAGMAPAAAAEDTSEGFVDADYLCSETAEHYTDILRLTEPFDDVHDEQAAFEAVRCLFVLGIVWGTTPTQFDPTANLSRSQLSALLARAWRGVGLECPAGEAPYVDVAANWAKDDIDCMWQLEVTVSGDITAGIYDDDTQQAPGGQYVVLAPGTSSSGGDNNKFDPGGSVTNAQFALMAANAWHAAGFSCDHLDSVHFTDVDYSSQAGPAIYCLQQLGVLPLEASATTLQPDTAINRADAVTLLARLWREDHPPPTTGQQQLQQDPTTQTPAPTKPAKPAKPTLTAGDTKINATWTAPSDGGSPITSYGVRHRATGAANWDTTVGLGTATLSHEIASLTNGTEYEVQVQATNTAGSSDWSDSAKATPVAPTAPDAPDAPTLTRGNATIDATWKPPDNNGGSPITGYTIRHRATGTDDWTTSSTQTGLSDEIGSLTNGTEYEVQVRATNAVGNSDWSDSAKATPAVVPAKPAAPGLAPDDQKITATWTAPNNGGSAITGYNVQYRATGAANWDTTVGLGTATLSREIASLTNGTEYEVQVQATNAAGDSDWSDSTKATPRTVPSKPSPTLTRGNTKIDVSWSAPNNGGSAITGYTVRHRVKDTDDWTTSSSQTTTSYEIGSLTNGTEYEVQVQAANIAGNSGYSDSATATPAAVPDAPAAATLTAGNAKLTAAWTAPDNGGSAITGYKVRHRATGTSDWTTSSTLGSSTSSHEIGSLTNGTEYEVQVQASNSAGDSGWSDSTEATPYTVPSKPSPTLTPADQKLTASWTAPSNNGRTITGYTIRHRATGTDDWTTSSAQTGLSYQIGSLTNGTEYEVQVQATNAAGDSGYSDSVKAAPRAVPDAPAAPTLTAAHQKLTAQWAAPSNGGSAITGYKVRHRATGTDDWTTSSTLGTSPLSYEIGSLTNGTEYEVQVQATNAAGDSGWSASTEATPRTVPTKPAAPTLAPDDQKITATWTAPNNGGSAITGYTVRHRATGTSSWTTSDALSKTATSHEIGSLTNGTEYEVQVQATNVAGDSGYSDSTTATPRTVPSKPAAPTLAGGNAKLTATWTAPNNGGSDITGYTIRHRATDTDDWTTSSTQTGLTYEIGSLTNGTEYEVQVQAANVAGDSGWSDSAEARPKAAPSKTTPALTPDNQKLTATWTEPDTGGPAIIFYKVRHRATGTNDWTESDELSASTRTYDITGLTNGTEYEVQVNAKNRVSYGGWSDSAKATPRTVPSKPAAPTLTWSDQKLTATWTAPNNGGNAITGYTVRHRATGTTNWTTTSTLATSPLSYEIASLTNGTEYEVQVQATNEAGNSAWSDSAKDTPRKVPDKPSPTLTPSDQKLTAAWTAPHNGGSAITGYTIRHRATDDENWTTSSSQTGLSKEIGSLTNGTEYEVQVQATNSVGDSGWSDSVKATACDVPSKPAAPTLTPADQKLTAAWTAPANNGCDITGYTIRHRAPGAHADWTTSSSQTGTSYEIGSLTNGTEYEVQVQATNAAGDSAWSDSVKATPRTVPDKPSPTLTPANKKITASWTAPDDGGSAITGYTIRHRATGATDWTTSSSQTGLSKEIGSLTNGTEYEVQVQATNVAGDSGWSDSVKATACTVPSKASPSLTPADQKITASWSAPSDGGCDITGYTIRHRATGTSSWTTSSSQTGLSKEIGSLTNGTEYEVQVQATNAAGDSGWSDSVKATPRTVPSKPSPTLTAANEKLTASWSAPSDGGSAITGYTIRHRDTDDTDWTTSSSQTGLSYEIGSLTNGEEYEVQVQATNVAGDSGWSDSVKATPRTKPSKPAAPTLTAGNEKLTASWTAPANGGSAITAYKVRHRDTDDTDWTTSSALGTSTLSYEISSLTNGEEHEVQVQATNAAGDSAWSDSTDATPRTKPSKPSPTLTPADQKLTASWSAPSDGGSAITGYTIRHRATGTSSWTTSSSQTGTSYEMSSLTNGTEYEVQVQATNVAGDSGWSDSVKATPRTKPSKPAAPTLAAADKKLTATWTAPANGGSSITGYKVRHRKTGATDWTTSSALGTSSLSYDISSLTNNTEYEVQVQATNVAGDSAWSDSSKATPPLLAASSLTDYSATLTLSGTISGNTTGNWWLKRTTPADTTCTSKSTTYTHDLTSLDAGTSYTYTAYSDSNCSKTITEGTFTTLKLAASKVTENAATLTLSGYSGDWYYKNSVVNAACSTNAVSGSTTNLTGLDSGTSYTYSAFSDSGCTKYLAEAASFTTSNTAVLNLGAGPSGLNCRIGRMNTSEIKPCLVGFRTGSNSGGYTVDSITANMSAAQTFGGVAPGFTVSLHTMSALRV